MSYYLILESLYTLTGREEEEMYRPLHTTPKLVTLLHDDEDRDKPTTITEITVILTIVTTFYL